MKLSLSILAASACIQTVFAHGSHGSDEPRPDDWALWHLEEEHRKTNGSFHRAQLTWQRRYL